MEDGDLIDVGLLYRLIHRQYFVDGKFRPSGFGPIVENTVSVTWGELTTPEESREKMGQYGKDPDDYGVAELEAPEVNSKEGLWTEYAPQEEWEAHANIVTELDEAGTKDTLYEMAEQLSVAPNLQDAE